MSYALKASLAAAGLFFGMLILLEAGRRIGIAGLTRDPEGPSKGAGAVEGAVFALLGLLVAFTFSGAASRFEDRRHLIAEEANAIGTAYLRVGLLPSETQGEIRALFRRYVDTRSGTYRNVENVAATNADLAEAAALQGQIWGRAPAACRRPEAPGAAAMLLLPALNEMIDITTTRAVATQNHPPWVIFLLLGGLSLVAALLAGHGMSGGRVRSWLHMVVFAATLSLTCYVILDLEFPREGLIRVDAADQPLIELKKSMQ